MRNNGVVGLWQGLLPTMLFRSWFFVFWSSYQIFTQELKKMNLSDGSVTFIAGGLSATAFWTGAFPSGKKKKKQIIVTHFLNFFFWV